MQSLKVRLKYEDLIIDWLWFLSIAIFIVNYDSELTIYNYCYWLHIIIRFPIHNIIAKKYCNQPPNYTPSKTLPSIIKNNSHCFKLYSIILLANTNKRVDDVNAHLLIHISSNLLSHHHIERRLHFYSTLHLIEYFVRPICHQLLWKINNSGKLTLPSLKIKSNWC